MGQIKNIMETKAQKGRRKEGKCICLTGGNVMLRKIGRLGKYNSQNGEKVIKKSYNVSKGT